MPPPPIFSMTSQWANLLPECLVTPNRYGVFLVNRNGPSFVLHIMVGYSYRLTIVAAGDDRSYFEAAGGIVPHDQDGFIEIECFAV